MLTPPTSTVFLADPEEKSTDWAKDAQVSTEIPDTALASPAQHSGAGQTSNGSDRGPTQSSPTAARTGETSPPPLEGTLEDLTNGNANKHIDKSFEHDAPLVVNGDPPRTRASLDKAGPQFAETDEAQNDLSISSLDTRAEVGHEYHGTNSQESLAEQGLGRVPYVDEPGHYIDLDNDPSEWRSGLESGTATPSHPADRRGQHGHWSTFRNHSNRKPASVMTGREREPEASGGGPSNRPMSMKAASMKAGSVKAGSMKGATTPIRSYVRRGSTLDDHTTSADDTGAPPAHKHRQGVVGALGLSRFVPRSRQGTSAPTKEPVAAEMPSMTNEMMAGTLPVMILKTWLDRDEDGHRTVPVLISNLRFRISDGVPIRSGARHNGGREVFKIECEYGDGAIKWMIYRELRDFISLHYHYKAANLGTRVTGLRSSRRVEIPDFPWNSLPYWARERIDGLKDRDKEKLAQAGLEIGKDGDVKGGGNFGPNSRAALEQYLVDLIRAVMFRPESNRLCIFFELSALTVALGPRGGFQGKAGFIKILSSNISRRSNQPGILPTSWRQHREPKWFVVRESYCVMVTGPAQSDIYDVFIFDHDFHIERPKRVLRQGLHLLSNASGKHVKAESDDEGKDDWELYDDDNRNVSQHTFYISNSQNRLKLVAKNARLMHQFMMSMERVAYHTNWTKKNRFDSFAPIRVNVAAQWLVDGRDYFWNLSRAIKMAKSRIYIHDWWISPELYLRRPGDERYRLDNLLKRKAEEGVRIFIIIYNEVSAKTTPVESLYVKKTLTALHPNIMLQRSPSHLPSGPTGALLWSHHEKLCVIDEMIAFMGGLDLSFGRWDTSQHIMVDEDFTAPDGPDGPVWRGKDYWNERVLDFTGLEKPFEDGMDRSKTPRMPWHDIGLHLVGQPARDLCRHFCQRWNHLLRIKNHTRKMPFLLPPADFTEEELVDLKLEGTCEVQIVRSCGPWSMGTTTKIEHSIASAYTKCIALSEHFVYIENQFFITSTWLDENTRVENGIGDALVARALRAHREGTKWRACIVIPLLPGAPYPIDSSEASSVRLILECQNRSICRGAHSIFSRLRKEGIEPDDYITFFSLRGWSKFKSGALTTEQVYIHAKTMIIDDRVVITGSANINERSMRGDRDSELAAVIRDTDMVDSTMAGKPFKVGRYAHSLRMRLMREHCGIDVDAIEEDELLNRKPVADASGIALWDPDNEQSRGGRAADRRGITRVKKSSARSRFGNTLSNAVDQLARGLGENAKIEAAHVTEAIKQPVATMGVLANVSDIDEAHARVDTGPDGTEITGFASSVVPTLEERTVAEQAEKGQLPRGKNTLSPIASVGNGDVPRGSVSGFNTPPPEPTVSIRSEKLARELGSRHGRDSEKFGTPAMSPDADDYVPRPPSQLLSDEHDTTKARSYLRKHLGGKNSSPWAIPTDTPQVEAARFYDPLDPRFWNDMWVSTAVHNTQLFRKVFRCTPDDLVTTWAQYKEFANHMDKFGRVKETSDDTKVTHDAAGSGGGVVGPAGSNPKHPNTADLPASTADATEKLGNAFSALTRTKSSTSSPSLGSAGGTASDMRRTPSGDKPALALVSFGGKDKEGRDSKEKTGSNGTGGPTSPNPQDGSDKDHKDGHGHGKDKDGSNKPSGENDPWAQWELNDMEELLNHVQGHLVIYPTRFLEAEDMANNFLFNQERILPLAIYD